MTFSNRIPRHEFRGYRGSINLKRPGTPIEWTNELLEELQKCSEDPIYFGEKYMKIVTSRGRLETPKLYPYQKDIINSVWKTPSTIAECARQSGKTSALTVIILWYILFNDQKTVAILANKGDTAREILSRIRKAYEHLPDWLQQGVVEWNKGSVEFENGSRIIAAATSSDNLRGWAIDFLFVDEAAWIEHWDEFWTSISPTVEARQNHRVVLVSTVNGLNHFHKYTTLARQGKSHFNLISVTWKAVPGRDEKWKQRALANMNFDYEKFAQEYENEYLGSSGTLITGSKLKQLVAGVSLPHTAGDSVKLYKKPEPERTYALVADVSRGKGLDYSAFQIIDVTELPYQQVLVFRDNITPPSEFAEIINRFATHFNTCPVLIEINDIGAQVADLLWDDFSYENLLFTEGAGARGKKVTQSMRRNIDRGIRTTKLVKNVGCSILKLLIEQDQLLIHDQETIHELSTFSKKGNSYEAEEGKHDDLVMALVLFAWLSEQGYFKQLTNINTLLSLREKTQEEVEEDLIPFGINVDFSDDFDMEKALELDKMTDELWILADEQKGW